MAGRHLICACKVARHLACKPFGQKHLNTRDVDGLVIIVSAVVLQLCAAI